MNAIYSLNGGIVILYTVFNVEKYDSPHPKTVKHRVERTLFNPIHTVWGLLWPRTLKMLDKILIQSIFFMIFHEFVSLLARFHKPKQINSCMRCAEKNMVITPGVINDPAEIEHFVQIIV